VSHFAQYADESDEVPKLKGKNYSDFYLQKHDWEKLELMHEVRLESQKFISYCSLLQGTG
jgi:hypothetical protein